MSFQKQFKNAKASIKTTTDIAVSNGMNFTVQIVPLENEVYDFPPSSEVFEFTWSYVKDTMKFKELNPRALKGMEAKWKKTHGPDVPFVPKLQPSELLVVLIAPSDTCIHLFTSVPKSMTYDVNVEYSTDQWDQDNRTIHYAKIEAPAVVSIFKYRDQLSQSILNELKTQGIYIEDDSDDEVYNLDDIDECENN